MKKTETIKTALLSLAFLALGGCLLLSAAGLLRAEGVTVETLALGGGEGRLYRPAAIAAQRVPLFEEPTGGAHTLQPDSVVTGGSYAAALLLCDGFDGAQALSVELARRGVAVLIPGRDVPAEQAWTWLTEQDFTRLSSVALIAGETRAAEALRLGERMAATDRAAASTVVLGDADTLRLAADYPGRNLLILTAGDPGAEARSLFFGGEYDARRDFTGYFSEGTARAVTVTGRRSFLARDVLSRSLDWQGSALGHAVELPDDDTIYAQIVFCRAAAALCALAAALIWLPKRKKE